jgi:hypothetical protein
LKKRYTALAQGLIEIRQAFRKKHPVRSITFRSRPPLGFVNEQTQDRSMPHGSGEWQVICQTKVFLKPNKLDGRSNHARTVLWRRQATLQCRTSSQHRSHFFLQVKGLLQTAQIFSGK